MDKKAMYKLSYGLFVLTAKEADKDNGCIINTAIQAASEPNQLSICVNKQTWLRERESLPYQYSARMQISGCLSILGSSPGGM